MKYTKQQYLKSRIPKKLKLGDTFNLRIVNINKSYFNRKVKFIKVTPKGFNLLNLETNKTILKRHIYPDIKRFDFKDYDNEMTFWVNKDWKWEKIGIII
jgi:hypothetical protein